MQKFFQKIVISLFLIISFYSNCFAQSCEAWQENIKSDKEYRVTFGDSGVGGLIFALDVTQELEKKLKNLEKEYAVKFIFNHFGDSENAPYGNKDPKEVRKLTQRFVSYQLSLPNVKTAVIACNTASTVFDDKMQEFFKKQYPDINIIAMINDSSSALINSATNNKIAIIATPVTVASKAYQSKIHDLDKNKEIYSYAPQKWVKNIESGEKKEIAQAELEKDLKIFRDEVGKSFKDISAIGLFCTHYPLYKKQIKEFFKESGNKNITVLTQGHIFSQKIYDDILRNLKDEKNQFQKRQKAIPYECIENLEINAEFTGDNIDKARNVIKNTHPQLLERIKFSKVTLP